MRARLLLGLLLGASACAGSYRTGIGYTSEVGVAPSAYEHYIRGRIASDRGDHDTAIAELRMASACAPDEIEPRIAVGDELLAAGRFDAARGEAVFAVHEWPKDAEAWRLMGRVLAAGTDVAGAAQAF